MSVKEKVAGMLFPASSSKLQRGLCGYSFNQHYGLRVKEPYTWSSLTFGSDMHRIFERIVVMMMEDPDAVPPVNSLVHQEISPEIANRANEMIEITDLFVQKFPFNPNITGVELSLGMKAGGEPCGFDDDDCIYRGKVDVMEVFDTEAGKMAIITDHKTTMHYKVNLDDHFQLIGYAFLAKQHWPEIDFFRIRIYFARGGFYRQLDIGDSHFARWKQAINARFNRILSFTGADLESATPNDFCNLCGYQKQCPAMSGDPISIKDDSSAVDAARQFIALKAATQSAERGIKEWVESHGPIDTGFDSGLPVLKMEVSSSDSWDFDEVHELLSGMGYDLPLFAKIDTAALRRLMKNMPPEQKDRVMDLSVPSERVSFKAVSPPKMK